MHDIIGKKYLFFLLSGLIIIPGLISLAQNGLRLSIDFTGGTLLEIKVEKDSPTLKDKINKIALDEKVDINSIQSSGKNSYIVRSKTISQAQVKSIEQKLSETAGKIQEIQYTDVGPTIGAELTTKAIQSVIVASIMIILYIAWSFREVPKPASSIRFGICAVVALLHDVLVIIGLFSIFGLLFKVEIDSLFVTALLTIIGFSVHDTIVVFDRIRENLRKMPKAPFSIVVNESIIQTLNRSLNTSLTVIFTLLALLLFGGTTIRWFVMALLIGIISGTYSSIFNASPLLVLWQELEEKRDKK